ncbi:MAG: arylsulfatase [Casimicrobiaceae bacterium]
MQDPHHGTGFEGHIDRTRETSTPSWRTPTRAATGAPNVVIVYMDDMGFSDPGCFGGEIDTPHIDALAARGLRFNHYTTHPLCSPARAALLTGMNAHAVGTGWLANNDAGYPGYSGEIPLAAATLAETFRASGYETIAIGKWHNTPTRDCVPSAPKTSWPTSRGFDTYYGFMEGEAHFFFPAQLMMGHQLVPIDTYPRDYYTTDDWTTKSIQFIKELRASDPAKPFLLYLAHNAVHAPLQAKPGDLAKYRGRYDAGWTAAREVRLRKQKAMGLVPADTRLPASDPRVPPWDDTDPADRELFARHMEAYAAMLDCVDQNLGRLVTFLDSLGELDNTIVVFASDNGGADAGGPTGMFNNYRRFMGLPPPPIEVERASAAELGGPRSASLYPTGWGEVSNTPFPSFKTYTGGGGRRVSFIVSWPARIKDAGAVRNQFAHVTDVFPTLLELAGVEPLREVNGRPALERHGRSFAPVLFDGAAASPRTEQYYECWSNRAFYRDGWLARSLQKRGDPIDLDNWTLHDLNRDFSESEDLRSRHPDKLAELTDAFDQAAWQYFVYPLDNRDRREKFADAAPGTAAAEDVPRTFLPGMQTVHRAIVFPLIASRSFRITVRFTHGEGNDGVLWAIGDPTGGMVLFADRGKLVFHYNGFGERTTVHGPTLPAGARTVTLDYEAFPARQGRGRILVDDAVAVDWTAMAPTMVLYGVLEGLDIGLDRRGPVLWELYEKHGAFGYPGTVHDLTIEPGKRVPN